MRVPPAWDREPTGKSATERPMDGLEACPKREVPVARRSVGSFLAGFDWGFAGSWMFLPRHAVNTSLYAHPKHPCFVRSWEEHPTPAELCESGRGASTRSQFSSIIWCPFSCFGILSNGENGFRSESGMTGWKWLQVKYSGGLQYAFRG